MAEGKRRKRELNGLRVAMILIVIGLLIGIGLVVKNIISLSLEKRALEKQNSDLTNKRDELTTELENVNDTDYIEEQARKLLHMIKPGEVLYIISNGGLNKTDSDSSSDVPLPEQPGGSQGNEEISAEDSAEGNEEGSAEGSAEGNEEGLAEVSAESTEEFTEGSGETTEEVPEGYTEESSEGYTEEGSDGYTEESQEGYSEEYTEAESEEASETDGE